VVEQQRAERELLFQQRAVGEVDAGASDADRAALGVTQEAPVPHHRVLLPFEIGQNVLDVLVVAAARDGQSFPARPGLLTALLRHERREPVHAHEASLPRLEQHAGRLVDLKDPPVGVEDDDRRACTVLDDSAGAEFGIEELLSSTQHEEHVSDADKTGQQKR
jgi:hypothetical protein